MFLFSNFWCCFFSLVRCFFFVRFHHQIYCECSLLTRCCYWIRLMLMVMLSRSHSYPIAIHSECSRYDAAGGWYNHLCSQSCHKKGNMWTRKKPSKTTTEMALQCTGGANRTINSGASIDDCYYSRNFYHAFVAFLLMVLRGYVFLLFRT